MIYIISAIAEFNYADGCMLIAESYYIDYCFWKTEGILIFNIHLHSWIKRMLKITA
jgi:hypothetical protein